LNFLSHFYFDRDTHNPELGLGLILPDLIHQHNKAWTFRPEKNLEPYSDKTLSLVKGWIKHKQVDKYFHNSPYFTSETSYIKERIQSAFSQSPVWCFFLAHITLELTLDSLLINESLVRVHDFYSLLEKVDEDAVLDFLEINGIHNGESFIVFFNEFLQSKYLLTYAQPEELTYPLGRICFKIWKEKFTDEQNKILKNTILEFCEKERTSFLSVFHYIKNKLIIPQAFI